MQELRARTVTLRPLISHFYSSPERREWLQARAREHGLAPEVLEDPHAWLPAPFYYEVFHDLEASSEDAVEKIMGTDFDALSRHNLGSLHVLARAFGKPTSAYARYPVYLNSLQEIGKYELHVLNEGTATISFTPQPEVPRSRLDCAYRRKALEEIPMLWGLPPAHVTHECCLAKGDPKCIYEIVWVPMSRRWVPWLATGAGFAVGTAIWSALFAAGYAGGSTVLAALIATPWPLIGYLGASIWLFSRRLKDTSVLMNEQMGALDRELRNVWAKCEEVERRASSEAKVRKLFQRYVPSNVVESVLEEGSKIVTGGEKLEVTVLFADLVGFTTFAENAAPEAAMDTVNIYLGKFSEVVHSFGGVVDKYMGDCVMAVFGAPVLDAYGPEKAVNCARSLTRVLEEINRQTGRGFELRIGIHFGEVVAGHVGSSGRIEYTVIGDVVNVAHRLQTEAQPGCILLSDAVRERCGEGFEFLEREPVIIRGRRTRTGVFELE